MGNFLEILNDSPSEDREYLLQYVAREAFEGLEQAGQEERAEIAWRKVEVMIGHIEDAASKSYALSKLGLALVQVGQQEQAKAVWLWAEGVIGQMRGPEDKGKALGRWGTVLVQASQWEQVDAVISQIDSPRSDALTDLGLALAQAGQWERAEEVIDKIRNSDNKAKALSKLKR